MQQIADWLKKLGMSEYTDRFVENRIDISVLRDLTEQHLKDLGIALGDRLKMLRAIRDLGNVSDAVAAPPASVATEPTRQDDAERRHLTIVFCDLVGSTALSTRLDPEELQEIIGGYHRCCAEVIAKSGGFVARYLGDGVLAYFGYPQAHEDDAERAARAGLALVEAVAKLDDRAGKALRVRIGIATGLVVVGDLLGEGGAQEHAVVGETPNLAARLQALAEPGTVVVDEGSRRLLGGLFEYRALGPVSVKGFGDPVPVWQVIGTSTVDSRFEALRTTTTPLVGREEEIELLIRRWQQAKRREGSVVLLSGEPGIGKSRIAQTILERLNDETHTPLRLSCSPHHPDSALYPSITQLERSAGFRREDTIEQRLDKLAAVLARATNDLDEAVPLLAALLSIPTGDRYPPLNLSLQKQKEKTLHALLAQVEGLAVRHRVLLVVEDAHWSDPTSRELFDLIIDRVPALPILMIVTFRPEFTSPWVGRSHVTLLSLSRLGPRQSAEMIVRLTGGKALPQEVVDQIIDRTDGVPLFIEELTKAVVESGMLTDAGDRYTMAEPLPPLAIPSSLNASLLARLDRLAPTREVAQIAASLGRQFSHELISAVATMPKQQLDGALAQLVSAELIFQRGMPPEAEYIFKHALVQGAAYGTLVRGRRQQIHARIVKVLESQFLEIVVAQPQLMAQHCTEAGLITEAIGYWIKAGRLSFTRSAIVEAALQLRKGLALLSSLVDSPERRRQELDLLTTLGAVEIHSKGEGAPTAWEAVVRARALCDQLSDRSSLGLVLYMQGGHYIARAEYAGALQVGEDLLSVAMERNDAAHEMRARLTMGRSLHNLGAFSSATGHFERLLKVPVPEANERSQWFPSDASTRTIALAHLAVNLLYLGHLDRAVACRDQALGLARKSGFPYALAVALSVASHALWLGGSRQAAVERLTELSALAAQHRFPFFLALTDLGHAVTLCARGKTTEGLPRAREAITDFAITGMSNGSTARRAALAYCCERAGEIDESLALLDAALETASATNERYYEAELHRLKGEWLLAHRPARGAEAESCYRHALAIARRQQAKFWELRAATSLARLEGDQGKRTEARHLLGPIYGWFTEGFDTPVLRNAKALLDELA